jgi:hypothetical protein
MAGYFGRNIGELSSGCKLSQVPFAQQPCCLEVELENGSIQVFPAGVTNDFASTVSRH